MSAVGSYNKPFNADADNRQVHYHRKPKPLEDKMYTATLIAISLYTAYRPAANSAVGISSVYRRTARDILQLYSSSFLGKLMAVTPYIFSVETVIDVEDEKKSYVENNNHKLEGILTDEEIEPIKQRKMTIAEALRPLLASMRLFGLYFTRPPEDAGDDPDKKSRKWNACMIYGAIVVTLLWINVVRMLSVFTQDDRFGMFLLEKLTIVIWSIQCAVSQTAFYAACFSGRLAVVFRQPLDDSCARHARKFSAIYTVVPWSIIMSSLVCFGYGLFFTDGFFSMAYQCN